MSRKRRQRRDAASSRRRKRKSKNSPSLVIPIVVGVVVITIIVGAIVSIENRRAAASSALGIGAGPGSVATAQSLATQSMPYPEVPRISLEETQAKIEQGEVLLVDVRSKAAYDKTHATGAVSIPETEIDFRIDEIPRDQDVVLYCT